MREKPIQPRGTPTRKRLLAICARRPPPDILHIRQVSSYTPRKPGTKLAAMMARPTLGLVEAQILLPTVMKARAMRENQRG